MKGWKTIVFNLLLGILFLVDNQGLSWGLAPDTIAVVATIGNFLLRLVTTSAVGKSE